MRAAIFNGPHSIEVGERPDPVLAAPTDAIVRVVLSCVCGSDLWYWRGESPHAVGSIGHESIGVVDDVGSEARTVARGDLVIAPFKYCDGTCPHCRAGVSSQCVLGGAFGDGRIDGGQGEAVLSAVLEMTNGIGVDAALECVGTGQSVATALAITRPGSMAGMVGVPHGVDGSIADTIVFRNVGLRGGVAPARTYIPELLDDVLEGRINPGRVFDFETDLDHIAEAYRAMDERIAIKSLIRVAA